MPSISITLAVAAALTALTAAVPHAHYRVHEGLHARDLELTPAILEDRAVISPDGTCGGSTGFVCAPGNCCSQWGYCGQGPAYCPASAAVSSKVSSTKNAAVTVKVTTSTTVSASMSTIVSTQGGGNVVTVTKTQYVTAVVTATPGGPPPPPTKAHTPTPSTKSTTVKTTSKKSTALPVTSTLPSKATTFSPTTTFSTSTKATSKTTTKKSSTSTTAAAPTQTSSGGNGLGDQYTTYLGDGTTAQGWPAQSSWENFESAWSNNLPLIAISCTQFGQENNSDEESADIKSAIQSVAASSGVDERFILAIMMQESKGCVRAPTTNYGVTNPGLMQSHDGAGSCNNGGVQDPCPQSEITQMITDGAAGTAAGDGLKQTLQESHATDVSQFYKAARIYNSGSIAASGNLQDGIATHCYASDIANRLTGWVNAQTKCTLG